MFIVKFLIIFQISTGKDLQKIEELRVRFCKSLDCVERHKIVKLKARRKGNGSFDKADGNCTRGRGSCFLLREMLKGTQERVVELPGRNQRSTGQAQLWYNKGYALIITCILRNVGYGY